MRDCLQPSPARNRSDVQLQFCDRFVSVVLRQQDKLTGAVETYLWKPSVFEGITFASTEGMCDPLSKTGASSNMNAARLTWIEGRSHEYGVSQPKAITQRQAEFRCNMGLAAKAGHTLAI